LDIEAKEIIRLRKRLYEILADSTGQEPARVERDCDRNKWLDADESVAYGCVDKVLMHQPEGGPAAPPPAGTGAGA
jgi:ATP-dependent Clp protease protease subunit